MSTGAYNKKQSNRFDNIHVESSRSIARTTAVAEQLSNITMKLNMLITQSGMPSLYGPLSDVLLKFLSKVIVAVTKVDKETSDTGHPPTQQDQARPHVFGLCV